MSNSQPTTPNERLATIVFMVIGGAVMGLLSMWQDPTGQEILKQYWWVGGIALVVLVGLLAITPIRRRVKAASVTTRAALLSFVLAPLIFGTIVMLGSSERHPLIFRVVFLLVVCLFPASLYYLFVASRRHSLVNEFVINLERLGLLEPYTHETDIAHERRIVTYLDKVEAVYGRLDQHFAQNVVEGLRSGKKAMDLTIPRAHSFFTTETSVPVLVATVLIALGWLVTMPPRVPDGEHVRLGIFSAVRTPVYFAFLGAYFFSVQMLFRRYLRRDLHPGAYTSVTLRIILAVIGTWVAVEVLYPLSQANVAATQTNPAQDGLAYQSLLYVGFAIGVFPSVVWQMLATTGKRFGAFLRLPSMRNELPLSDLDGLTIWHEARFEEEDIENIPNLATADIVELLLHTRIPPDRIVDWLDQAILYTALGAELPKSPKRAVLRAQGIRNAVGLMEAYRKSILRDDTDAFEKLLPGSGRSVIRTLVDTVDTNPNLRLVEAWRGMPKRSQLATIRPGITT